jgi:inhibitor of cysteine peptidase
MSRMEERTREFEIRMSKEYEKTSVYKISIDRMRISYSGSGQVPGRLLNQFSMDEHKGFFRVATTTGNMWSETSLNHLYVLDERLRVVGSVEDIAPTERIYSARFLGDKAYMVTFREVDPFFVIDLSNPRSPEVLGELKIPGYSTYLHPYSDDLIIGIGKEVVESEFADPWSGTRRPVALEQGVKLSLFDVSDFSNPKEISKIEIGGRGTNSIALYEHKAFLFDKEKGLLVIPISEWEGDSQNSEFWGWGYGMQVFEGAYVFSVSERGFELAGKVTHMSPSEVDMMKNPDMYDYSYGFYPYGFQIFRSTYIGDTLYTLSSKYLKAHSLSDFSEEASIVLPSYQEDYYRIMPFPMPELGILIEPAF